MCSGSFFHTYMRIHIYTSCEWCIYGVPQIISSFPHKTRSLQHLCLTALAVSLSVCSNSCAGPLFRTFSINKR